MGALNDLAGERFGRWVVKCRDGNIGRKVAWLCECECGNLRRVVSGDLTSGKSASCGCASLNDLIGKKFGKLTVLKKAESSHSGSQRYLCRCSCGGEIVVQYGNLLSKSVAHCGCSRKSVADMTGFKVGRLTVIKRAENSISGRVQWLCECECGNKVVAVAHQLVVGDTQSCGCLRRESIRYMSTTHGLRKHPLYMRWLGMKDRCLNSNNKSFIHYGGRGILICQEWIDSFKLFYDFCMSKGWNGNLELDRINNNGNYEPSNLRFVTRKENVRNRRITSLTACKVSRIHEFLSVGIGVNELGRSFRVCHNTIARIRDGLLWA